MGAEDFVQELGLVVQAGPLPKHLPFHLIEQVRLVPKHGVEGKIEGINVDGALALDPYRTLFFRPRRLASLGGRCCRHEVFFNGAGIGTRWGECMFEVCPWRFAFVVGRQHAMQTRPRCIVLVRGALLSRLRVELTTPCSLASLGRRLRFGLVVFVRGTGARIGPGMPAAEWPSLEEGFHFAASPPSCADAWHRRRGSDCWRPWGWRKHEVS